jgi:excinuclease UvrABC ATPase subunit
MAFMDPVTTVCEMCEGRRYNSQALSYLYKGRDIQQVLDMTVTDALDFFEDAKIIHGLTALQKVGIGYMTLGQPLSTLSGGERQRIKLAKHIGSKGGIFVLDEPTTGLHLSDVEALMALFNSMVEIGNTIIVIEHNIDVIKQADWIIDIGPDGGKNGGRVIFEGTPGDMVRYGKGITAQYLKKAE